MADEDTNVIGVSSEKDAPKEEATAASSGNRPLIRGKSARQWWMDFATSGEEKDAMAALVYQLVPSLRNTPRASDILEASSRRALLGIPRSETDVKMVSPATSARLAREAIVSRFKAARPGAIDKGVLDWGRLVAAYPPDFLKDTDDSGQQLLQINSGGQVLFCLMRDPSEDHDHMVVVKFNPTRLAAQAEQFANEITRHLGIAAPKCRLVRKMNTAGKPARMAGTSRRDEWLAVVSGASAAGDLAEELSDSLGRSQAFLLMEHVRGDELAACKGAFSRAHEAQTARDLGRVFLLDLLLANPDRLPCRALKWRGNTGNLLFSEAMGHRIVAIDSTVPRRPPGSRSTAEHENLQRIVEVALNTDDFSGALLQELVADCPEVEPSPVAVAAFKEGMRLCLADMIAIKGLLEMMHNMLGQWVQEFIADVEATVANPSRMTSRQASDHLSPPASPTSCVRQSPAVGIRDVQILETRKPPPHGTPTMEAGNEERDKEQSKQEEAEREHAELEQAREEEVKDEPSRVTLGGRRRALYNGISRGLGMAVAPVTWAVNGLSTALSLWARPAVDEKGGDATEGKPRGSAPSETGPEPSSRSSQTAAGRRSQSVTEEGLPTPAGPVQGGHTRAKTEVEEKILDGEAGSPYTRRYTTGGMLSKADAPSQATPQATPEATVGRWRPASASPATAASGGAALARQHTKQLREIGRQAKASGGKEGTVSALVDTWRVRMSANGDELRRAVTEWHARHATARVLSTGFLDGTHPIVDSYELEVRLEHLLARLDSLQLAASSEAPARIRDYMFLGSAVAAGSQHLLRHLGITHILNATEDVLMPGGTGFNTKRIAVQDTEEADIASHFETAADFIDSSRDQHGNILVHCFEGKSRSATLVLSYLMRHEGLTLKQAVESVRRTRPEAAPNAGFLKCLLALDIELHGSESMSLADVANKKAAKPKGATCPICGAVAGVSQRAVAAHMRAKHPRHALTCALSKTQG